MFFRFLAIISFACSLNLYGLSVKSLAELPYHPDARETGHNLFTENNASAAVDHIFSTGLSIQGVDFVNLSLTAKTDKNRTINIFSTIFSDPANAYAGYFHYLPLSPALKLILNVNPLFSVRNINFIHQQPAFLYYPQYTHTIEKNTSAGGKLLTALAFENFRAGAYLIALPSITIKGSPSRDFSVATYSINPKQNTADLSYENYYYQLSVSYKINEGFFAGLSYDNQYSLNNNTGNDLIFPAEIFDESLSLYNLSRLFQHPFYRFNASSTNNSRSYFRFVRFPQANPSYEFFLTEVLNNSRINHLSLPVEKQFENLRLLFKLDLNVISYQADIHTAYDDLTDTAANPVINSNFKKSGTFYDTRYKIFVEPKPFILSADTFWYLSMTLSGCLYSKVFEKIELQTDSRTNIEFENSVFYSNLLLISGFKIEQKELWFYLNYKRVELNLSQYALNNLFKSDENQPYATYSGKARTFDLIYPAENGDYAQSTSATAVKAGLGSRFRFVGSYFDLGGGFTIITYPELYDGNKYEYSDIFLTLGYNLYVFKDLTLKAEYLHRFIMKIQYHAPENNNEGFFYSGNENSLNLNLNYKF